MQGQPWLEQEALLIEKKSGQSMLKWLYLITHHLLHNHKLVANEFITGIQNFNWDREYFASWPVCPAGGIWSSLYSFFWDCISNQQLYNCCSLSPLEGTLLIKLTWFGQVSEGNSPRSSLPLGWQMQRNGQLKMWLATVRYRVRFLLLNLSCPSLEPGLSSAAYRYECSALTFDAVNSIGADITNLRWMLL